MELNLHQPYLMVADTLVLTWGIMVSGIYGTDFDPKPENIKYSWAICRPMPGFRVSIDYRKTWKPCPFTLDNPLFPKSGKKGQQVKLGTLHFVDFGKNLENSPDGMAYLVEWKRCIFIMGLFN